MPWQRTTNSEGKRRTVPDVSPQSWNPKADDVALEQKTLKSKIRMIDWIYALRIVVMAPLACFLVILLFGVAVDSIVPTSAQIVAPWISLPLVLLIILSAPLGLLANSLGYVFEPENDKLTYPSVVLRRSIRISDIRDANAQTITSKRTIDLGAAAGKNRRRTVMQRLYRVNVSGDFGVRVMRFTARYKRDQFLSILRTVAPECRITRGYWY
jgi:hypothetical protein